MEQGGGERAKRIEWVSSAVDVAVFLKAHLFLADHLRPELRVVHIDLVRRVLGGKGRLRRAKRGAFLTKHESSERAKIVE